MNAVTVSQVYINMLVNYLEQSKSKWPDQYFSEIKFPSVSSSGCERLPLNEVESLVVQIANATKNSAFGLDIGEHIHPSDYGIFGYTLMNCPTLAEAAKLVVDFGALLNQAFLVELAERGDNIHFQLGDSSRTSASHILVELHLASVVQMGRFLAGPQIREDIVLSEVRFQHSALADQSKYERIFGCAVLFRQEKNEIVVSNNILARPIRSASPSMLQMLLGKLTRLDDEVNNNVSLGRRVGDFVTNNLSSAGVPSASIVAKHFNMSLSTLKKRLHLEQLNYSVICDDVRKSMAMKMLASSSESLQSISDYLGFSNASAFHRAFRRWVGVTPVEYRRQETAQEELVCD